MSFQARTILAGVKMPPTLTKQAMPQLKMPESQGVAGCPIAHLKGRLREVNLRPTRQRMLLGWLLFGKGDRHITAEQLFGEVNRARVTLSLATVYNTLNQFRDAGLLRTVASVGDRAVYDTNTGDHHHFVVEQSGVIFDFPDHATITPEVPPPPPGYRILGVDVVVRLEKIGGETPASGEADE